MIKIEKLIYGGFGLGHDEFGKTYMVKKSVPGDTLDVDVLKDKKKFAEAKIKSIVHASEMRELAPCPHFDQCGGCEHQNISYENQLILKQEIFTESLIRAGIDANILPIIAASEDQFHYRNVIRFYFFIDSKNQLHLAMHDYCDASRLFPIGNCLLQSKLGSEITEKLLDFLNQNVKNKKSLYQLRLREGRYTGDFMIELITSDPNLPYQDKLKEFICHIPEIKSFYHTIAFDQKNYGWERRLLAGSPIIYEKIGKYSFQISPESFFQTNSEGVKILYDKIKEFADIKIGDRILDLYCGTGTIGIYLSTLAKNVTGIEIVQNAINDANANAKINRTVNTEFVCTDAAKWLKNNFEEIKKSQNLKIILDPPREGLNKDLIQSLYELSNFMNFQLIYISCNPSTFARDIKIFEENGMKLEKVQPIDMFPQTHHIECVAKIIHKTNRTKS